MGTLTGQVAIVTGGAGVIGRAICRTLMGEGAFVVCLDKNRASLMKFQSEIGLRRIDHVLFQEFDIMARADRGAIISWLPNAIPTKPDFHVLVNCVGVQPRSSAVPLHQLSREDLDLILDVNLKGPMLMSADCLPHMIKQGFGRIINIGSVTALRGAPGTAAYTASKAGLHGFTRALAMECAPYGITVNTVVPGSIPTPLFLETVREQAPHASTVDEAVQKVTSAYPLGRLGTPEDVAGMVAFLAGPRGSWITGQEFVVDGGVTAKAPWMVEG